MKRFCSGSFFSGPEGNAPRESRRRVASHRIERSRTTVASVLFALAAILTGLVALGYSACGQDAVSAAEAVDFILTPENGELATGGQISLAVMVGASETANVDRAEVHLNYPEELLQVVEAAVSGSERFAVVHSKLGTKRVRPFSFAEVPFHPSRLLHALLHFGRHGMAPHHSLPT
jgi:hypothetical protein